MKNRIVYFGIIGLMFLGGMRFATAQTPGIPYQAYIINTNAGYVPGEQLEVPLVNATLMLQFEIRNSKGEVEYIEQLEVTTDEYGMVSAVVGIGSPGSTAVLGAFEDIVWDGLPKQMHIDIDFSNTGTQFQDHGQMQLVYIPGPTADLSDMSSLVYNGDGSYTYTCAKTKFC